MSNFLPSNYSSSTAPIVQTVVYNNDEGSSSCLGSCAPHPEVRIWDVVNELVCLCTNPSPSNPLALDVRYVQNLPLPERLLATGALLHFLEAYVVHGNRDELHYDRGKWRNKGEINCSAVF